MEAINKIEAVLRITTKSKTKFQVAEINYHSEIKNEITTRLIEPFAIYNNLKGNWMLIAFSLLRKEFRLFRIDRIKQLYKTNKYFEPHKLTLKEYIEKASKNISLLLT